MKKFLLFGFAVVIGLGLLSYTTTKTFRVEVFIPAPPEAVWAVLADTDSYPEWNPLYVQVDGSYEEGGSVTAHVRFPDGSVPKMSVSVDTVTPAEELRQSGGVPGFITFDHQWLLEPAEGGTQSGPARSGSWPLSLVLGLQLDHPGISGRERRFKDARSRTGGTVVRTAHSPRPK